METKAQKELKKDLNNLLNPKEKETPENYLKRMEKEFNTLNDDYHKLNKINNKK